MGHVDHVRPEGEVQSCRGFCSVPGPLQSVQTAEMWSVILALQSSGAVHLGVDNLSVVRHVGRLLDGHHGSAPFELVKDGDLLLLIEPAGGRAEACRFSCARPDYRSAQDLAAIPPSARGPCRHADGGTAGGSAYRRGVLDGDGHGGRGGGGGGAPHLDRRQ